jgi:hypothetical protein
MGHFWIEQLNANKQQDGDGEEKRADHSKEAVKRLIRDLIAKLKTRGR